MNQRIAVAIPTFNRANFVVKALLSLKNQIKKDFDIYVFDNCSTDETVSLVSKHLNDRVFLQVSLVNEGFVSNMNKCLQLHEKYDWVGILHSDDYHIGESISLISKELKNYPNAGILFSKVHIVTSDDKITSTPKESSKTKLFSKGAVALHRSLESIPCSSTFYNSKAIREVGGFDPDFPYSADEEFNNRISEKYDIVCIGTIIANHLIHKDNLRIETWLDPEFISNYEKMRLKMFEKISLNRSELKDIFKSHMSSTCLGISSTLARNGFRKESLTYNKLAWKYNISNFFKFSNLFRSVIILFPSLYVLIRKLYLNKFNHDSR